MSRPGERLDLRLAVEIDSPSSPVEIVYADTGNLDAPHTLLLLHGLFDHKGTWRHISRHLDDDFRLIAPDLIGSGHSDKPAFTGVPSHERYSTAMQAAYLREFINRLELTELIVVGHSLGGGLALYLACSDLLLALRGLVLVDAAAYPQPLPGHIDELIGWPGALLMVSPVRQLLFQLGLINRLVSLTLRHMFFDAARMPCGMEEAAVEILRAEGIFYAHRQTARNMVPDEVLRYDELECPTLIIWGENDRVVPALNALRLEEDIRGSRLHVFTECGHVPHLEYPHETAVAIRDWVRYQLPTPATPNPRDVRIQ